MKAHLLVALCSCALLVHCGGRPPGAAGVPQVSLSASSLGFGTELVGGTSEPLSVTLSNSGTATLHITDIAASTNFAETTTCAATLMAGANCTISVTFTPTLRAALLERCLFQTMRVAVHKRSR